MAVIDRVRHPDVLAASGGRRSRGGPDPRDRSGFCVAGESWLATRILVLESPL